MSNKTTSITFRVSPALDTYLIQLAKSQAIDKSKLLNRIIQEYGDLQAKGQQLQRAELNLKEVEKENRELKKQNAFFESTKLDFLFDELRGKIIEGHPINTKNDLLRFILHSFEYSENQQEISLHKKQHQVNQPKNKWVVPVFLLSLMAVFVYLFYAQKKWWRKTPQHVFSI